eukprot:g1633.t1 g1633   contig10:2477043-2478697(-)
MSSDDSDSTSTTDNGIEVAETTLTTNASSNKLEEHMITRIVAIDNIRTILKNDIHRLLEKELEHDNELMAEFTEEITTLKDTNKEQREELKSLSTVIDELVERNATLESEAKSRTNQNASLINENEAFSQQVRNLSTKIAEATEANAELTSKTKTYATDIEQLKQEKEQLSEMVTALTTALKETKRSLENEVEITMKLESEKLHMEGANVTMVDDHKEEIVKWEQRVQELSDNKTELENETIQLKKTMEADKIAQNMEKLTLQSQLDAFEQTIIQLNQDKENITKESETNKSNLKKEIDELKKTMEEEQRSNDTLLAELQTQLSTAELTITLVNEEKERIIGELESDQIKSEGMKRRLQNKLREDLGEARYQLELEAKRIKNEASEWATEKKKLQMRTQESEKALVMLAKDNDQLQVKLKAATIKADATTSSPQKKEKLATELAKLQLLFFEEKKVLMDKQQELEGMLMEAMKKRFSGDNEEILKSLGLTSGSGMVFSRKETNAKYQNDLITIA